jgi:hypothetical protein
MGNTLAYWGTELKTSPCIYTRVFYIYQWEHLKGAAYLTHKYTDRLKMLATNKDTSLFYKLKSFVTTAQF